MQSVKLDHLTRAIVNCWISAENQLRSDVLERHWNPAEEDLTFLFCGLLRESVSDANKHRRFEHAFAADLNRAFPDLTSETWGISAGLAGAVSFHGRHLEGKSSAADVGLLLVGPSVHPSWSQDSISIGVDNARALLGQAKLGRPKRSHTDWGQLTDRQRALFPQHAAYMSLLLYRLSGAKGDNLAPFEWQLCAGASVKEIESWLGRDSFPAKTGSTSIIERLANGVIGTDDPKVCKLVIDPTNIDSRCIEIRVSWPDGEPPGGRMIRRIRHSTAQNLVMLPKLRH